MERLAHHPQARDLKTKKIISKILRLSKFKTAKTVLFYLPVNGEIDLTSLFEKKKNEKKFILPRVKDDNLDLFHIPDLSETEQGAFKILEPKTHLKRIKAEEIDLILVPGVVFAHNGHRIGYGKGFYDRLLKKATCLKIGIAYDFQMVKNIPGSTHDVPMDKIITEKRTITVKHPFEQKKK